MSNVAVMEPRPTLAAGARIMPIIPTSMEDAYRLATAVCKAGVAPKGMDTPEKCLIAILRGLEVGLSPMQAIDKIAIVGNRPTIWGDGALGLVRASGLCEYVRETVDGQGEARVATCEVKRRGEPDPIVRRFGVGDAKKAGLWGKSGPWQQYADRMLSMRARAFALRDGFADVLGGLYLREEFFGAETRREPAPAQQLRRLPPRSAQIASPQPQPEPQPAEEDEIVLTAKATAECGTEKLREYLDTLDAAEWDRLRPHAEDLQNIAAQADAGHGEAAGE
jgi:hypothetical protein